MMRGASKSKSLMTDLQALVNAGVSGDSGGDVSKRDVSAYRAAREARVYII